ncbi:MAG TPA: protein phosphatase 2C domain-containing protein [Feifaniaceae bacterium]|nr:protein phosphatase 2C domain-containing protein [Feifaniaceae bacterium]
MDVRIAQLSSRGGRSHNEDSIRLFRSADAAALAVADGLGGHGGGDIASAIAADTMTRMFADAPDASAENLRAMFEEANRRILREQNGFQKMKSTCVTLLLAGNAAAWGHVGDSRLYHFTDGALKFQTADHSVSYLAYRSGEIPYAGIRFHEDRNKVLRALGNEEEIKPEIAGAELSRGFHAFLLCTDGLWEYVLEPEMQIDLCKSNTPEDWISFLAARLIKRVSGRNDNFSAAAVFLTIG